MTSRAVRDFSWAFGSRFPLAILAVAAAAGCADIRPYVPPSQGHITAPAAQPQADSNIPPPARTSDFLPAPKPTVKPQTYSVVVNEVPVKDLLLALARDTNQNIDVHSGLTGLVSLNAINETLPAILERVSKQVNMRYRTEGNTIIVGPDVQYVKTYRVNYVNMARETTSTVGVTGEIAASGSGTGGAGGASTSGSSTTVRTTSRNDFWELLRDNLRSILNSTRLQSLTADARAERMMLVKQEQELRAKQIEAASRAGTGAPALATAAMAGGTAAGIAPQATLLPDDVVVNSVSGTVTVNATDKQHQLVQQHIDSVVNAMQRQVLIEATIVEVTLTNAYQAGIDWSRLPISGGPTIIQNLLGGFGAGLRQAGDNSFSVGYVNTTSGVGNIRGTVRLLEEFGNTRVLSSPKLMALNNQTALLKVVDNIVYFEIKADTTQNQTGSQTNFSTTAKTVGVGVVMGVTPQINEDGRVTLTVRPTISRVLRFINDPNPALGNTVSGVPEIQVREMESVLQVGSGQTVVLGGLMQDNVRRDRDQLPGADFMGPAGELLRFRDERSTKSELVIFLRPVVVANASLESDELKFLQRFLPNPDAPPTAPVPDRPGTAR